MSIRLFNLLITLFLFAIIIIWLYECFKPDFLHNKHRFNQKNAETILKETVHQLHLIALTDMFNYNNDVNHQRHNKKLKPQDRVYLFNNHTLNKMAHMSLGLYSNQDQTWLKLWMKCDKHNFSNVQEAASQFITHYDPEIYLWYVYPINHAHKYCWVPIEKAIASSSIKTPDVLKKYQAAFELLMLHLDIGKDSKISWKNLANGSWWTNNDRKADVLDRLTIVNKNETILIDLKNFKPYKAQIYPNADVAEFANTTIALTDLYHEACEKSSHLQKQAKEQSKRELKRA